MCCNGALFDYGELEEHECGPAAEAGLSLSRVKDKPRFQIPCSRLVENRCTAYAARPGTCRSYACQMLKKFEAGEVSGDDALARVHEAQGLIARIKRLLPDGMDLGAARNQWKRAGKAAEDGETSEPFGAELTLNLFMLNRLLDRHFRKAHQRTMSSWLVEDGPADEARPTPVAEGGPRPPS
jgi:Fe-S-cluster containining protein